MNDDRWINKETKEIVIYDKDVTSFYCEDDKIVLFKTQEGKDSYLEVEEFMNCFEYMEEA